jgi:transposase, IS5 family
MLAAVPPDDPGEVYADLAYESHTNEERILRAGACSRLPAKGIWGNEATWSRLESWNREAGAVRRIEKIVGVWERYYGLRRMRWLGLMKLGRQMRVTAIAYNVRRSVRILQERIV